MILTASIISFDELKHMNAIGDTLEAMGANKLRMRNQRARKAMGEGPKARAARKTQRALGEKPPTRKERKAQRALNEEHSTPRQQNPQSEGQCARLVSVNASNCFQRYD